MATQTIDYAELARQHGAISSQPEQVDYDALAKQHGATSSTAPANPNMATISAYQPTVWDRVRSALPIVDRIEAGLSGPASSNLEALTKPAPGMSDERAIAPEQAFTRAERQAHPIRTGALEFAGGMSTPGNMLLMGTSGALGQVPGAAGRILPRVASGIFSAQTLRDVYNQIPNFRNAYDRGDTSEALRIFTHITLGAAMAGLGLKHGATGESIPTTEGPIKRSV